MNRYTLAHLRDVIILPFSVTVLIPWWITKFEFQAAPWWSILIGVIFLLAGLTLLIATIRLFYLFGRGTLAPWDETQQLVIVGPYRYTRNPMISGVLFILAGETAIVFSLPMLYWCVAFLVINTLFFIVWEEPRMEARFGESYRNYCKNVGRWLPRFYPFVPE